MNAISINRSEVVYQLVSVPAVMTGEVGDLCLTQWVAVERHGMRQTYITLLRVTSAVICMCNHDDTCV